MNTQYCGNEFERSPIKYLPCYWAYSFFGYQLLSETYPSVIFLNVTISAIEKAIQHFIFLTFLFIISSVNFGFIIPQCIAAWNVLFESIYFSFDYFVTCRF